MTLSWEKEASESLVQSRHSKGLLLSYLLAPGTGNLRFEEVVNRVLQENREEHRRAKEKSTFSLNRSLHWQTRLLEELNELSKRLEAAKDKKVQREVDKRMDVIQTALEKVEASIAKNETRLEESWIWEEEAHHGDQNQSDSSEGQYGDVVVEESEESGLTGAESTDSLGSQETEPSMEVDVDSTPLLTSGSAITVSAEEDQLLTGDPTSVAGEMAKLQVSFPNSHKPEGGETSQ